MNSKKIPVAHVPVPTFLIPWGPDFRDRKWVYSFGDGQADGRADMKQLLLDR